MQSSWQPYREPLRTTLIRTITIALIVGFVISRWWGGVNRWPLATVLVFWPSFGGHWVDLFFLNWLRPRLSATRAAQVGARVGVWFVGGTGLGLGVALTARYAGGIRPAHWPAWWLPGLAFICIELVAQLALQLRGHPSFYNGRG